jgi:uncharacterized membrane protein
MASSQRETISDSVRFRWDILLFTVFVASTVPAVTSFAVHEWLGVAFAALVLVHLLFNWRWIIDVSRRMFSKLPGEIRFNHIWDALLFVLLMTVTVSGLLISEDVLPALGFHSRSDDFWREIHDSTTTFLMMAIGVHIAMHARWLMSRIIRTRRPSAAATEKMAENLA